jgi:hypothetical protein
LVVVSIVVIITALLLVRQSRFNSFTLLCSLADFASTDPKVRG